MATKQELEAQVADLEARLAALNSSQGKGADDAAEKVQLLMDEVAALKQENALMAGRLKGCSDSDHAVIGGRGMRIVEKDRLKDVWERARKRFVDEDSLCLVLSDH